MFNYKQSIYTTELKYMENDFEYYLNSNSGERDESSDFIKISSCENLLSNTNIRLNICKSYLITLQDLLKSIKKELRKQNVNFSSYMKLHNEKVLIDNKKEDNRSYGFIRIILKDSNNNIHMDDISITESDPENLEAKIRYYVKKNLDVIKFSQGKSTCLSLKSTPVILSPQASGYFIHEILGHILENDFYSYYKDNYKNLEASGKLTVCDSVKGFASLIGISKYDDVGTEIKPLTLINKGIFCNVFAINSKDSFDNKLYGVARRESYKCNVIPRMRGTYIMPFDNMNGQDILEKYQNAIFIDKSYLGGVNPQTGDYSVTGNGFIVKDRTKQNFIGNLKLSGNIIRDLSSFDYIGNDFEMFGSYCMKMDQCVRVGTGGPTISLSDMTIEGDVYGTK